MTIGKEVLSYQAMACHSPHPPHFHSFAQMLDAVKDGVRAVETSYSTCVEPMMLSLTIACPMGQRVTIATASVQPPRARKSVGGLGGYRACHLFKHKKSGVTPYLTELLRSDKKLQTTVFATPMFATSKKGNRITNLSLLVESLADKLWATMSHEEKQPWKTAAEVSKQTLDGVDWKVLEGKARKCASLLRFVAGLHALVGIGAKGASYDNDGVPAIIRRFL